VEVAAAQKPARVAVQKLTEVARRVPVEAAAQPAHPTVVSPPEQS